MGLDLLDRLDRIMAELVSLRAEIATDVRRTADGADAAETDDLAPEHLLDTTAAEARFGHPRNTIALWCRTEGLGVRSGGRWLVSVPRLKRRLNGG